MAEFKRIATWGLITLICILRIEGVERIQYEVIESYPHDSGAWTQGLYYSADGRLFESTGLRGQSTLRKVDLHSGEVLQKHDLDERYFAEGLTEFDGKLYQLTWELGICFVYDRDTFEQLEEFRYFGQGWGLTHNDDQLIMSDGSDKISFRDPETFEQRREIEVKIGDRPIKYINELEYIDGFIYANVWYSNVILKIAPDSGQIVGTIDLSELWPERPEDPNSILNGIAYMQDRNLLLVTGKFWSQLFAIRVDE